jgi:hypothetical protein
MRRRSSALPFVTALMAAVVVPIAINVLTNRVPARWGPFDMYAAAAVVMVWVFAVVLETYRRLQARRPVSDEAVERVADALARVVRLRWDEELGQPAPLAVRWSTRPAPMYLTRDMRQILGSFRKLAERRVVILGDAGAGKTVLAMLLTVNLIRTREAGEPVPVLLSLSDWPPDGEHFDSWLAGQLIVWYPTVCDRDSARELVHRGLVLPVLDGLDEVPPPARMALFGAVAHVAATGRPFVLTCRRAEYEALPPLPATRLNILPVGVEDAIGYLKNQSNFDPLRRAQTIGHLRARASGSLALALSSPLMLYLAGVELTRSDGSNAVDLTDERRFRTRDSIEAQLLDGFVPAVYADRPTHFALADLPGTPGRYRPERVVSWLGYLAGAPDIAWWELGRLVGWLYTAVTGLVVGLLTGSLYGLAFGPTIGALAGLVATAGTAGLLAGTGGPPTAVTDSGTPRSTLRHDRRRAAVRGLVIGVVFGVSIAATIALTYGFGSLLGSLLGFAFGLTFSLVTWLDHPWGAYTVTRSWLALIGRIPWRLDRFLADAHRRGVLRQSGTRYVFRHELLRRHLAVGVTSQPPAPAATSVSWHRIRARTAATVAVLTFLFAFTFALLPAAPWPEYRAGTQPEQVTEVVCADAISCGESLRAYRWPLVSGQTLDTTFGGARSNDLTRLERLSGDIGLDAVPSCAAVIEWQLTVDGRVAGTGTAYSRTRTTVHYLLPDTVTAVRVAARRRDDQTCTAALLWNEPAFGYGFSPG